MRWLGLPEQRFRLAKWYIRQVEGYNGVSR
jgi:hypothetical protein